MVSTLSEFQGRRTGIVKEGCVSLLSSPTPLMPRALSRFMAVYVLRKREGKKSREAIRNCFYYLINLLQQIIYAKHRLAESLKRITFW